jgi:hypothetical protein
MGGCDHRCRSSAYHYYYRASDSTFYGQDGTFGGSQQNTDKYDRQRYHGRRGTFDSHHVRFAVQKSYNIVLSIYIFTDILLTHERCAGFSGFIPHPFNQIRQGNNVNCRDT